MFLAKWIDFSKYVEMFKEELEALSFKPERLTKMLGYMGKGMLVIFVIIGVIILSTIVINRVFSSKKSENK